jgi:hypothetical protein
MRDGTKGASAHAVSEECRIELTRLLMNLRETNDDDECDDDDHGGGGGIGGGGAPSRRHSITLPPDLTNTQRKFVHELSKQLGLKSKSHGKGEDRKVVVSKVRPGTGGGIGGLITSVDGGSSHSSSSCSSSLPTEEEYRRVPRINVGREGEEALRKHVSRFPPTPREDAESRETGSSMLLFGRNDDVADDDDATATGTDRLRRRQRRDRTEQRDHRERRRRQQHERTIEWRVRNHVEARRRMLSHPQYERMMKQRTSLPAYGYANDICDVLRDGSGNQVVILTGDTGCG